MQRPACPKRQRRRRRNLPKMMRGDLAEAGASAYV